MTPHPPHHDAAEMAALYVAGALTAEEAAAFEARLANEPACLAEFRKLEPVAAALFASVSLPPPAAVREALESRVAADATVRNVDRGAAVLPFGNPSRLPWR